MSVKAERLSITVTVPADLLQDAQQVTGREPQATVIEALDLLRRTTYGVACQAVKLYRGEMLKSHVVAKRLGVSPSYVRSAVRLKENLEPEIILAWKKRDKDRFPAEYAATSYVRLLGYARLPIKEQVRAFNQVTRAQKRLSKRSRSAA